MERIVSADERIRRAEELYYRRRNESFGTRTNSTYKANKKNKDYVLLRKLFIQIIVCLLIYLGIYVVKNSNYIFSEEFLKKVNSILEYDMEVEKYFNSFMTYINEETEPQNTNQDINNEENKEQVQENVENQNAVEENVGGVEEKEVEKVENLSQMEIDAQDIKNTYNLIKPLEGTITSRFGQREPTTPTVPKNHTGIDIAATTGTTIVAALDGTVEVASGEGDYGNHLKIVKDDVCLVYAHCNKLYKKQGDTVAQGEAIAEVGATGNVTGPHLHFEIRKSDRYVNPDYVLEF